MLYLIGLGLNEESLTLESLEAIRKSKKIYLENYTIDFPYNLNKLKKTIKKKIFAADRKKVESQILIIESKKQDICLLVYGSPLFATTHFSLINDAKKLKADYKIIHNASIFDAVAETGLQMYRFGKITSLPKWEKHYQPTSFIEIIKQNLSINSHTLILCDIKMKFHNALRQFENSLKQNNLNIEKLIVCQALGTPKRKIFFNTFNNLKKAAVKPPYCFIIPSKLNFSEKEFLKNQILYK